MNRPSSGDPRVALVSIGLGRIRRGFERYFGDLFDVLRGSLEVTVYKAASAERPGERVAPLLGPATAAARLLPLGVVAGGAEYRHYKHDCLGFGLALVPELIGRRFDVVHIIDPPMISVFRRIRHVLPRSTRILFTNGCHMPTEFYPEFAHVHHVAQPMWEEALEEGVDASRMSYAACGIHTAKFELQGSREQRRAELRARHGVADATFVVLAVTAVKRMHKRVDHLIEELSRVPGDILFWIDGNPEEPDLAEMARERLGTRCRVTHVPSEQVPELYHLSDVMVHGALEEAFGLAVVEAMSAGLPVVTHRSRHFEWLLGGFGAMVDMEERGALTDRIAGLTADRARLEADSESRSRSIRERFDWASVMPHYLQMYSRLAAAPAAAARQGRVAGELV